MLIHCDDDLMLHRHACAPEGARACALPPSPAANAAAAHTGCGRGACAGCSGTRRDWSADQALESERAGYLQGARHGRVAGFCWGMLLGALSVAAALELGRLLG